MDKLKIAAAVILIGALIAVFWFKNLPPACADGGIQSMISRGVLEEMQQEFGTDKVPDNIVLTNVMILAENNDEGFCRCSADFLMNVPKNNSRWTVEYSVKKVSLLGQYDVSIKITDPFAD